MRFGPFLGPRALGVDLGVALGEAIAGTPRPEHARCAFIALKPCCSVVRLPSPRRIMRAFIVEEQKVLKQVLVEKTRTKKAASKGGKRR